MKHPLILLALMTLTLTGCQTVGNSIKENVFGMEKREILQSAVESVQKDQAEAKEDFQDAMTELKKLYNFDGGKLERAYNKFKKAYENSESQADTVSDRIKNMDRVAKSLFSEWEKEIKQYSSAEFSRNSRQKLQATQDKYADLLHSAQSAERTMDPILKKLGDHVLYLKHNLNAASLGTFKNETRGIESEIEMLTSQMNASINEASKFIQNLSLA